MKEIVERKAKNYVSEQEPSIFFHFKFRVTLHNITILLN